MTKQLGVVMDPVELIHPKKDSTLAMLLAAQMRGYTLHYMTPSDLYLRDGIVYAQTTLLKVYDDPQHWFDVLEQKIIALHELGLILMRKDPPFDLEYIYTTHLLERAEHLGCKVVNRPQSLRDVSEKLFTAWFPQCCPPSLVTRSHARLFEFLQEQGEVIFKPLEGMGGASIFRIKKGDTNAHVVIETLSQHEKKFIMAQRFIPEISSGDKRILLIDGIPIPYALARIPAPGDNRGNLAAGAHAEGRELNDRDRWICNEVGPVLRAKGLRFVGIDVIGNYLTEINVTSPTCIRELNACFGLDIAGQLMDALENQ